MTSFVSVDGKKNNYHTVFFSSSTFAKYAGATEQSPSNPTRNVMIRHPNCDRPLEGLSPHLFHRQSRCFSQRPGSHLTVEIKQTNRVRAVNAGLREARGD